MSKGKVLSALIVIFILPLYSNDDLLSMSLEDLMDIKITSVSKTEESHFKAASAIFVITEEDIHRTGARSIMDALRMVPGMQVNQENGNAWHIGARGHDGRFNNKMLVLIDGRVVFTPAFSGVYWETIDIHMPDVERIEVIRGPGSTIWGSNAVNGVINVITKKAKDTEGGIIQAGYGDYSWETSGRYGFATNEEKTAFLRVYTKFKDYDALIRGRTNPKDSGGAGDQWDLHQSGLRFDWDISSFESLTLSSDYYEGTVSNFIDVVGDFFNQDIKGYNFLANYKKELSADQELNIKAYYDYYLREGSLKQELDTYDLEIDYRWQYNIHSFIIGAGYRHFTPDVALIHTYQDYNLYSAFIQDRISLIQNELLFTIGTKFEYYDLTKNKTLQPSARLAWTPNDKQTFWIAYAQSKRNPSLADHGTFVGDIGGGLFLLNGSESVEDSTMDSYEIGYRQKITENLTIDLAAFYFDYKDLVGFSGIPQAYADNLADGDTHGLEATLIFRPIDSWKLTSSYTYTDVDVDFENVPGTLVDLSEPFYGTGASMTATHKISLHSFYKINKNFDFDVSGYYMSDRTLEGFVSDEIDAYFRLDARLAWHVTEDTQISIQGYNLLDSSHEEASSFAEIPRSFLVMLQHNF